MSRSVDGTRRLRRRRKIIQRAKGFRGRRKSLFRTAKDAVRKSLFYAYRDRRVRKRDFRRLWIARLSAACAGEDITYSRFINGLKLANVELNRKSLSNLAAQDQDAFRSLVEKARTELDRQNR